MWENIVERDRAQMAIWRMRVACWITKATNKHSDFVEWKLNLVAHGDAREEKSRGKRRMEWVAKQSSV